MTLFASIAGNSGKKKDKSDNALEERMKLLEAKINAIYETSQDKDGRINKLENDVRFLNRLIEDKTPQAK